MNVTEITPKANVRLNRIRLVARFFRWICLFLFGVMIFMAGAAVLAPYCILPTGSPERNEFLTMRAEFLLSQFKPGWEWLYPLFWAGMAGLNCLAIWFFYRFFGNLERGIIFDRDNVRCFRGFGCLMVASPVIGIIFDLSRIIWQVPNPAEGFVIDGTNLIPGLVGGFLIVLIAWIMDEGRKIQEEQELTV